MEYCDLDETYKEYEEYKYKEYQISQGGKCPGGICPRGVIVRGYLSGGNCPGGNCPGGNCPDTLIYRFLLGAVQQLKLLPRVNTSHFLRPRVDGLPYFNGPKANK